MAPTSVIACLLLLLLRSSMSQLRGLPCVGDRCKRASQTSNANLVDNQSCLRCNVARADVQFLEDNSTRSDDNHFFACMTDATDEPDGKPNQVYRLDGLPKDFVTKHKRELLRGNSRICIPQGKANRSAYTVDIPKDVAPVVLNKSIGDERRHLTSRSGVHYVLVVRVSSTMGEDCGVTHSDLQSTVFGLNTSLASQYLSCSHGLLNIQPATGRNVCNGILDVNVTGKVLGGDIQGAFQNTLYAATTTRLGITDLAKAANHIMFCLPPGTTISGRTDWVGFSYINGWASFFQRGFCLKLSAQVHEIGHELGLVHSAAGSDEYGDHSGMLGLSYIQTSRPLMCFNGHKNWISGWFDDRKASVNPLITGSWVGNLVTFVDYANASQIPNGVVLLNVGDLYLQLNSAKKFNIQTMANANQVTIVQANSNLPFSYMRAGLSAGQNYTYPNFNGTGYALIIENCNQQLGSIDYAKVSVYLNNYVQKSQCSNAISAPIAPTAKPVVPTTLPTVKPATPTIMPVSLTTKPFLPTTVPVTLTVKPVVPSSMPVTSTTKPAAPTIVPVAPTTLPTAKPVTPTIMLVSPTIKPLIPTSAPVTLTVKPVVPSSMPVTPTTNPVVPTIVPVAPTTKPVVSSSLPTVKPVTPTMMPVSQTIKPMIPTSAPVAPTAKPVVPSSMPVAPTTEPVAPTFVPVAPTTKPVAPTIVPIAFTTKPVAPSSLPLAPTAKPVTPTIMPVAPAAKPIVPISMTLMPTVMPVAPTAKPFVSPSIPVAPTSMPIARTTKPFVSTIQPVAPTTKPVVPTFTPVAPSTKPFTPLFIPIMPVA